IAGCRVLGGVPGLSRLRYREKGALPDEKPQRDLARGCAVRGSNFLEHLSPGGAGTGKVIVAVRAVAHDGHAVALAPGNHGVLDGALVQMVKNLVAGA